MAININPITKKIKKHNPKNLSGTDLINPKKKRKNHSGIILSDVLTTLQIMKDSSWNTQYHPRNTNIMTINRDTNNKNRSLINVNEVNNKRSK